MARELSRDLRLLVAAQPTRGVDVGSIEFIHTQIVATRDSGVPVLVVSTELDEVVALADRIMVLYRGRIVGIVPPDTPREVLGLMMTGERPEGSRRMTLPHQRARPRTPHDALRPPEPEPEKPAPPDDDRWRKALREIASGNAAVAFFSVLLAVAVGSLLIMFTDDDVRDTLRLHVRAAGRLLLGLLGRHLGRLHRPVPRLDLQHPRRRTSRPRSGR